MNAYISTSDASLGISIRELRMERGFSLRQLSKLSGLSKSTLSDIENGINTNPTSRTLTKVTAAMGITELALIVNNNLTAAEISSLSNIKQAVPELMDALCITSKDEVLLHKLLAVISNLQ